MTEIWKKIEGFVYHEVSNTGHVRIIGHKSGKKIYHTSELALYDNGHGYLFVSINYQGKNKRVYIHRLVLESFGVKTNTGKNECNHIDGNKTNNTISNLEWVTSSENKIHAYKIGLAKHPNLHGENNPNAKLKAEDVLKIRNLFKTGINRAEIAKIFDISWTSVDYIVKMATWKYV